MRRTQFYIIFIWMLVILSNSCQRDKNPLQSFDKDAIPDSTSHEFTWQIEYFGDGNASTLRDVCIIDENDVWAVGKIYLKDSTGQFVYPPYNAVHWNGSYWGLEKISTITYDNRIIINPLTAIFAFSSNEIIVSSKAGAIGQFNGLKWESRYIAERQGSIKKIWGNSINSFYLVGSNGSITLYNGTWQKLDSGTDLDIQDIWGARDPDTGEYTILAVASDKYHGGDKKILQIQRDNTIKEFDWTPQKTLHSIWFENGTPLYACGSGLFVYQNKFWTKVEGLPAIFKNRVRGNHKNDVFLAGDFGVFAHYNGNNWKVYDALSLPHGNYEGLAVKNDLVVAVGWNGDRAVVALGTRLPRK